MKTNYYLIIFLILGISTTIAQTLRKTYYDEFLKTKIKEEYQINENGEKNGLYKRYAQDGLVIEKANFLNGRLNGTYQLFMPLLGKAYAISESNYKNDIKDGSYIEYAFNDFHTIIEQGNFKDGKRVGPWLNSIKTNEDSQSQLAYASTTINCIDDKCSEANKWYYSNRQLYREKIKIGNYTKQISFYPDGKLLSEVYPDSSKTYYRSGKIKEKKSSLLICMLSENGSIMEQTTFDKNGEKISYESYDDNGNKTQEMKDFERDRLRLKEGAEANKRYEEENVKRNNENNVKLKSKELSKQKLDSVKKMIEEKITQGDNNAKINQWTLAKWDLSQAEKMINDSTNLAIATDAYGSKSYYFGNRRIDVKSKMKFVNSQVYKDKKLTDFQIQMLDKKIMNKAKSIQEMEELLKE